MRRASGADKARATWRGDHRARSSWNHLAGDIVASRRDSTPGRAALRPLTTLASDMDTDAGRAAASGTDGEGQRPGRDVAAGEGQARGVEGETERRRVEGETERRGVEGEVRGEVRGDERVELGGDGSMSIWESAGTETKPDASPWSSPDSVGFVTCDDGFDAGTGTGAGAAGHALRGTPMAKLAAAAAAPAATPDASAAALAPGVDDVPVRFDKVLVS